MRPGEANIATTMAGAKMSAAMMSGPMFRAEPGMNPLETNRDAIKLERR